LTYIYPFIYPSIYLSIYAGADLWIEGSHSIEQAVAGAQEQAEAAQCALCGCIENRPTTEI